MTLTALDWPIVAAPLQFSANTRAGQPIQDSPGEVWAEVLTEIADAGFRGMELTDSWLRVGDLSSARLAELASVAAATGIQIPSASVVRASVIDRKHGEANLAYAHRTLDAAAELGCQVVSTGLHQVLTAEQRERLWFWTADGYRDDTSDEARALAVARYAELGRHAADLGLLLSLELYEDTFLGTTASALQLIEEIGLSNVGLNPDVGNLIRLHRPVEDWREIYAATLPYANYWHVKNYLRDEHPERDQYITMPTPLEGGLISYREVVKVALECGFQGIICLENYGGDGLSVCASNEEYLRGRVLPRTPNYSLGTSRVLQSHDSRVARAF